MAAAHGAGRDPSACARGPESRSQPRTVHRLWRFVQAAAESKSGMDPRSESMGSEVWTRYGIGSMNQARSEAGIDSILSIYARKAHEITELVSDLNFRARSRTTISVWASWSSGGALAKNQFNLVLATQCAHNSR